MRNVIITNNDAYEEFIKLMDKTSVFVYLDPPYDEGLMNSKNVYRYNMNKEQQIEFLKQISNAKCKLLVSGYRDESGRGLYDTYLTDENGWHCLCLGETHKASSGKEGVTAKEWVWYNYELPVNASRNL